MKYLRTKLATDWSEARGLSTKVFKMLLSFIPQVNPGYDGKLHLVKEWFVEFDDENLPWREIALDSNGKILFAGPSEENYGFWLDTNMKYNDFEGETINAKDFEVLWSESGVIVT